MNQARDSEAEKYIKSIDGAGLYLPHHNISFKAGWDAALEHLRGKESDSKELEKAMHEFAMSRLSEVQRSLFEHSNDESRQELFAEPLAAGGGFYNGVMWAKDQNAALKERIRELENK